MAGSLGTRFIAAVIASGDAAGFAGFGNIQHLFTPTEAQLFEFVRTFVRQYAKLPDASTVEAHVGAELCEFQEAAEYYHDLMTVRYVERELKREMKAAAEKLGVDDKDPLGALEIMRGCVANLLARQQQRSVHDFRDAYRLIVPDYVAKFSADNGAGVRLGWPTFDEMTGGLLPGSLVSMVGKIARGKTWQLLYCCHHGWREQGLSQLFVSMEMPHMEILQRLTAMNAHIPVKQLTDAALSTNYLTKMKHALIEVKGAKAPLWVVDGNLAATVDDIWSLTRQLKPDSIWIDGGYLVKHPTERDRYRRVAENAELMKQELASIVPTIVSWQFAKQSGFKTNGGKKTTEKQDLDDIGYSYAIPQASSIVLGLFEDESVETMRSRTIEILKGRKGEVGRFRTRWDFHGMDFSELVDEPIAELQF